MSVNYEGKYFSVNDSKAIEFIREDIETKLKEETINKNKKTKKNKKHKKNTAKVLCRELIYLIL